MSAPKFTGVFTAIVTPFTDDDRVDEDALRALCRDQIEMGVSGLVACGTTGEAATLSDEEWQTVIKIVVDEAKGDVPVIAGAGANNTRLACDKQKVIKELGVDGSLQVTPWYNKPTQEGLFQHFSAVIDAADVPTILYNVPGRCGVDLSADTCVRLAKSNASFVAVKEATGSIQRAQDILCGIAEVRSDFAVLSGDDGFILGLKAIGGHGVISVTSHICADDLVKMLQAFDDGDHATAQALSRKTHPLVSLLFFRANPIPVKAALAMTRLQGKLKDHVRLPLVPLNDADRAHLAEGLKTLGYA